MEAVIFVGLQGAGKSTFYRERFFATHLRINLDMLKTRHREGRFLQACIETRQPFVVDNTNPTRAERQVYIEAAKQAGLQGRSATTSSPKSRTASAATSSALSRSGFLCRAFLEQRAGCKSPARMKASTNCST